MLASFASNPREKNTYLPRTYVRKDDGISVSIVCICGAFHLRRLLFRLSSLPPFIDTTYLRIFVALNHYMVYRYCSSTTGALKNTSILGTRRRIAQRKREKGKEGRKKGTSKTDIPYAIFIWIRLWIREPRRDIKFDIQMDNLSMVQTRFFPIEIDWRLDAIRNIFAITGKNFLLYD